MKHTAISSKWINVSSHLGLTSLLQSKELQVKCSQGRKVTPAAKASCIFQQPPGQPDFTRNGLLEKRMTVGLVAFCSQLVL